VAVVRVTKQSLSRSQWIEARRKGVYVMMTGERGEVDVVKTLELALSKAANLPEQRRRRWAASCLSESMNSRSYVRKSKSASRNWMQD
jgi:hypothetical protein